MLAILDWQSFATHCGRNDGKALGHCIKDLDSYPSARHQRNDQAACSLLERGEVFNEAVEVHGWVLPEGRHQIFGWVSSNHVHLYEVVFMPYSWENLFKEPA
jgi:hypothetical protein